MNKLLFILCMVCTLPCHAQFNDSLHYHIKYSSTGIINRTNDGASYILNNTGGFSVGKKSLKLNLAGSYIYGKQNQKLTNDDINAALDFNIYQTPRWYYWGLGNYDKSLSLKINSRYQGGLGLAWIVWKKENIYLNISDGVIYESGDLYLKDSSRDRYATFRNSFRIVYRLAYKKLVRLEGTHFIQHALSDMDDYIIRSSNTLSFSLTNWLSLTGGLIYNRVSRNGSENLLVNYGLTFEKYF